MNRELGTKTVNYPRQLFPLQNIPIFKHSFFSVSSVQLYLIIVILVVRLRLWKLKLKYNSVFIFPMCEVLWKWHTWYYSPFQGSLVLSPFITVFVSFNHCLSVCVIDIWFLITVWCLQIFLVRFQRLWFIFVDRACRNNVNLTVVYCFHVSRI